MLNILFNSNASPRDIFITIVAYLLALVFAFCMHEFAHGLVAYWNGDVTAKRMGRLTLNPLKHLDVMGTLLLLFVGFGWAKPVPVNSNNFKKQKLGIFTVSIAGVTMNLIMAILNFILIIIMSAIIGAAGAPVNEVGEVVLMFFAYLFEFGIAINLTLMAFNLIPIYPLDGFHVVEAFTKYNNKYCVFMRQYGNLILFALLILSSLASRFGGVFQYFDIIGMFINVIRGGIEKLMFLIVGII